MEKPTTEEMKKALLDEIASYRYYQRMLERQLEQIDDTVAQYGEDWHNQPTEQFDISSTCNSLVQQLEYLRQMSIDFIAFVSGEDEE